MKNTNKIDPMARAKKNPLFSEYSKEARARIMLATEIYNARTKKGLSQQELAKNINSTQKVISKIENGEVNIGLDLIFRLASKLGLNFQLGKTNIL